MFKPSPATQQHVVSGLLCPWPDAGVGKAGEPIGSKPCHPLPTLVCRCRGCPSLMVPGKAACPHRQPMRNENRKQHFEVELPDSKSHRLYNLPPNHQAVFTRGLHFRVSALSTDNLSQVRAKSCWLCTNNFSKE